MATDTKKKKSRKDEEVEDQTEEQVEEEDVEAEDAEAEDAEAEDEEDVEAEDDTEDAEAEDEEDVEAEDDTEDTESESEDEQDDDKTTLLHLDIQPFDLELLGLEVRSDGLNLELNAISGDGHILGNLLEKAAELLGKLTGGGSGGDGESGSFSPGALKDSVVERTAQIKDWIVEKVQFVIRFILGKLAHIAADRLAQQPSKAKGSKGQKSKKGTSKKAA